MTIKIGLDQRSIQNAIKKLEKVKALYPTMIRELLDRSRKWIMNKANQNLDRSDIGENVKELIKSQWQLPAIEGNRCLLVNVDSFGYGENKAVFVEFGVGSVGESNPHPMSTSTGYQYNVPSEHKRGIDGDEWVFYSNMGNLDIPEYAITQTIPTPQAEYELLIFTKGATGVMYLYNALVEFRHTGQAKIIWDAICKEYIK